MYSFSFPLDNAKEKPTEEGSCYDITVAEETFLISTKYFSNV